MTRFRLLIVAVILLFSPWIAMTADQATSPRDCGTGAKMSLKKRLDDCDSVSSDGIWRLVARHSDYKRSYELWQEDTKVDGKTVKVLWSDVFDREFSELGGEADRACSSPDLEAVTVGYAGANFVLPSKADFQQAEKDKIREVFSSIRAHSDRFFWTYEPYTPTGSKQEDLKSDIRAAYFVRDGKIYPASRSSRLSVHCVAYLVD